MRNKRHGSFLADMLTSARYEVLPTGTIEDKVLEHLPEGFTVTVTASPAKGLEATLALDRAARARRATAPYPTSLRGWSADARSCSEICARMREAGISTVFVPGGDQDPPAGDYTSALDLLEDLKEMGNPFAEVGITGYPESHPTISDDLTIQSMWDKRRHATHVVSNLSFDPDTIKLWLDRMRTRGITMPMLLGIPGPIDRAKLLAMATKIGVGDSARFLVKHKSTLTRLAAPGGFTGEKFLERCAPVLARPEAHVTGLHVYTFNQVAETEAWRREYLDRLMAVRS